MFHLAQVPFFAAGGYSTAILSVHIGLSPLIGILIGGVAAVILSLIIGIPSLRVRGIYLVFLTFSFHFIMLSLALFFVDITGGDMGLILEPIRIGATNIDMFNPVVTYYTALTLFVLSLVFIKKIIDSKIGLALVSLRDSEIYAVSRGINPYKIKLVTFVLSSFLAGVCGAFYVHYLRVITPALFDWSFLITFLASIVIGGVGTLYGPLIGAFILTFLMESLRFLEMFRNIVFGLLMILILIFMPKGLIMLFNRVQSIFSSQQNTTNIVDEEN
jgi:branched-chain amino acid transport system permease protein